jgi:hypothetical protein
MLDRGADAGKKQRGQDHPETGDMTERGKRGAGQQGAGGQQVAFAETFGDQPGGDLERGHRRAVRGADHADLRQRQAEGLRQQRQQHIREVGEAVVQRVRRTAGRQRTPGTGCFQVCNSLLMRGQA